MNAFPHMAADPPISGAVGPDQPLQARADDELLAAIEGANWRARMLAEAAALRSAPNGGGMGLPGSPPASLRGGLPE